MVMPLAPAARHVTPLTADQKVTLKLMQMTDPFCKHISKRILSGKTPSHEITHSHILKVSSTSMSWIQTKDFGTSHPQVLVFYSTH